EKNVLALVYFFSLINKEKKTNQFFKENNFIMLDDPISSFDFENKIGIYNYIRKQFKDVYSKNKYSQILITTHDMEVYYNLEKVFQDIILDNGKKLTNRVNKYVLTEIGLESDKKDKLNNIYSNQVKFIYEFANGNKDEAENYIGNTMRRVCEAFSTFKYRCGIDNLRTDKIVIETIDSEELKIFFENYLFRLILNNESHESDRSKGITDQNIIDYLTLNEKKKTAK
ncbi:AAA family ATPase, partial [Staphylococcus equorum]